MDDDDDDDGCCSGRELDNLSISFNFDTSSFSSLLLLPLLFSKLLFLSYDDANEAAERTNSNPQRDALILLLLSLSVIRLRLITAQRCERAMFLATEECGVQSSKKYVASPPHSFNIGSMRPGWYSAKWVKSKICPCSPI